MWFFSQPKTSVLMVCSANICRSPMAEGVLRSELVKLGLQRKVRVDSAGTGVGQRGRNADLRALDVCKSVGIDLRKARARQATEQDFLRFDYILAMDKRNEQWLLAHCPDHLASRISLITAWNDEENSVDIPDPYYGNKAGFDVVLDMLRPAISGFIRQVFE
tara:strand:+ start:90087 stop:90572 length:486 start_codon:yes stop_codon:yes gene_type:complete